MRSLFRRRVAVANGVGVAPPVGVFAVAILSEVAPLAFAAGDVMLDKDQIAFLEALAAGEFAPPLRDHSDVLVAHDHPALGRRRLVKFYIASADSRALPLLLHGVVRDTRHGIFADLGLAGPHATRRHYAFRHEEPPTIDVARNLGPALKRSR